MGVSVIQTDRLYWLGRYLERVYTTIGMYERAYDQLMDTKVSYVDFCIKMDIPNVYSSSEDFLSRYAFDTEVRDSLMSNLLRAHDNAIELREEIGSDALAYVELAIRKLRIASQGDSPLLDLQEVKDYLMAFWGITDDQIESENVRNIIKIGKRVERIDLYARMHYDAAHIKREVHRLEGRIGHTNLIYDREALATLHELSELDPIPYSEMVSLVESFLEA